MGAYFRLELHYSRYFNWLYISTLSNTLYNLKKYAEANKGRIEINANREFRHPMILYSRRYNAIQNIRWEHVLDWNYTIHAISIGCI